MRTFVGKLSTVYVLAARRVLPEILLCNLAFAKHKNELIINCIIHFDNNL